ncbi:hypothetical protein TNCV_4115601 [Trichonephila clavipes]|nr:hypothetical protein TNCV_4115601 [Trichonephila clavipes]
MPLIKNSSFESKPTVELDISDTFIDDNIFDPVRNKRTRLLSDGALSRVRVFDWQKRFPGGRDSVEADERDECQAQRPQMM